MQIPDEHGDVAFYWDAYRDAGCIDPAACTVTGYDIVDFRTKASVAKVSDQGTTATEISHAKLGDCFSIRAARIKEGPESTPHCVLAVRTTTNRFVGPSQIGQFQAVIHDNADSSYCTRRSWDPSWAQEPWGFSTAIHSFTEPAGNTGRGYHAHGRTDLSRAPGLGAVSLPRISRPGLACRTRFDLPAEAKAANASIVFAFTPGGVPSDYSNCFEYLWNPHRWFIHEGPAGHYTSPLMGDINGKVLDHDDNAIGTLTLASGRASYTYGQDQSILGAGHMAVELSMFTDGLNSTDLGNPRLHAGNYPFGNRSTFCGAKDPHIELSYVNVQTTAQPVLPQFEQSIRQTETPHVFVTAAPH